MENVKNIKPEALQLFLFASPKRLLNDTSILSVNIKIVSLYNITQWDDFKYIYDKEVKKLETCLEYEDWLSQKEVNYYFNDGTLTFTVSGEVICSLKVNHNSQFFADIQNIIKKGDYVYFNQWDLN